MKCIRSQVSIKQLFSLRASRLKIRRNFEKMGIAISSPRLFLLQLGNLYSKIHQQCYRHQEHKQYQSPFPLLISFSPTTFASFSAFLYCESLLQLLLELFLLGFFLLSSSERVHRCNSKRCSILYTHTITWCRSLLSKIFVNWVLHLCSLYYTAWLIITTYWCFELSLESWPSAVFKKPFWNLW